MRVKIIWLDYSKKSTEDAEKQLGQLMSQGWRIVAAGGGGHLKDSGCLGALTGTLVPSGFVVIAKSDKA